MTVRAFGGRLLPVALIVIVVLWWLPSGFNSGALIDEWSLLVWIDDGARPFFFPEIAPTRPLTYTPWIAALALTPESFVGMNILLCAAHAVKGLLLFRLLRRIMPEAPAFAWIGGVLFALFPADHGIFYMGAINIQWAVVLALAAVNLLIDAWRRPTIIRWIALWAVQIAAVFMYEAGIPLLLCAPLILLWLDRTGSLPLSTQWRGGRGVRWTEGRGVRFLRARRWIIVSVAWSAIPAAWFAYFIYTLTAGSSAYQASLLDVGATRWGLIDGLAYMLRQNLVTGFVTGLEWLPRAPLGALVAAAGIGVGVAWLAASMTRPDLPKSHTSAPGLGGEVKTYLPLILAGLAATLIGFAVFIPTRDFSTQQYTWRLAMFSSIGAAVASAAALLLLPRRIIPIAAGALIALAALRGMEQHERLRAQAIRQQQIVHDIALQAPAVTDGTLFVLIDASETDAARAIQFNYVFEHAIQLTYGTRTIFARLCYQDAASANPAETCAFADEMITAAGIWGGVETFGYAQMIAFQLTPDGTITLLEALPARYLNGANAATYAPRAHIDADAPPPARLTTLFEYRE